MAKETFKIRNVNEAAAAQDVIGRMMGALIMFLIRFGMFFRLPKPEEDADAHAKAYEAWLADEAAKASQAKAEAAYRTARLPILAKRYDERNPRRRGAAMQGLALTDAENRALPGNDARKVARAAVYNNARQDCWYLRKQWAMMVEAAFQQRAETLSAAEQKKTEKPVKTIRETFAAFAKDCAARNQRSGEVNAGDLSAWIAEIRESLESTFPPKKL